jgi:hypothetical protein
LAVVGVLAAPIVADEGKGEQGSSPGDPPDTAPVDKDEESEGRSGPVGGPCPVVPDYPPPAAPVFTNFLECVEDSMSGGGYLTTSAPFDPNDVLSYTTTFNGGAPPDMCICEDNPDVQYTALWIPGNRIAKIRKFSSPVFPQGGTITLYLNDVSTSFLTNDTLGANALNNLMATALQSRGATFTQTSKYFVVISVSPGRTPLNQVGFWSTDPGLIRSEISLEPDPGTLGYDDWLLCADGLETKCGD